MSSTEVLFKNNTPRPPVLGSESIELSRAFSESHHHQRPCVRWAQDFQNLLKDSDGIKLFKKFLDLNNDASQLDFIFACRGLKIVSQTDTKKTSHIVRMIFRRYIRHNVIELDSQIVKDIREQIRKPSDQLDPHIFDKAETYVENNLKAGAYPAFITSDLYLQAVQQQPNNNNNSSSSIVNDATTTTTNTSTNTLSLVASSPSSSSNTTNKHFLPTLPEESELLDRDQNSTVDVLNLSKQSAFSRTSISAHRKSDGVHVEDEAVGEKKNKNRYYCAYVPVSAQESELQSSSDALTDDTLSLTDSSVDGRCIRVAGDGESKRRYWKRNQKLINRYALLNKTASGYFDIPKYRGPSKGNLAETNPAEFCRLLSDRLNAYLREKNASQDEKDRLIVKDRLRQNDNLNVDQPMADNPQNILDEHVGRVFSSNMKKQQRKDLQDLSYMHSLSSYNDLQEKLKNIKLKKASSNNLSTTTASTSTSFSTNKYNEENNDHVDNGQKVLHWMMDKDNVGHKSGENSDPASHRKNSNKSSTITPASQRSPSQTNNNPTNNNNNNSASINNKSVNNKKTTNVQASSTNSHNLQQTFTVVGYFFLDEEIPYKFTLPGKDINLAQIKQHIKKGPNCQFFVKKETTEFEMGVVNEEVTDDNEPLPLFDGKIILTINKLD